jgi:cmgb10
MSDPDKKNDTASDENLKFEEPELSVEEVNTRKLQAIAVISFGLIALLVVGLYFFKGNKKEEVAQDKIGTQVKKANFDFKDDEPEQKSFKQLMLEKNDPEPPKFETPKDNPFIPAAKSNTPPPKLKVLKGSSFVMVSNQKAAAGKVREMPTELTSDERYMVDENGNVIGKRSILKDDTDNSYAGQTFTPTAAKKGAFNPNLLLPKGTYIGCSLDTRLVSSIKGGISCTVSNDVYSSNGSVLLIEKGSKITGFFEAGQMKDGLNRIFVVWQEIRTPNHINIPVYSGASDELGGSGIEGWVDHHWLERFGASILLSVIDDGFNVLFNGKRGRDNVDYTENTRETTKQMANTALEKFINIEPTLYKNQGDIVGVYVNRDIDFSKVYRLTKNNKKVNRANYGN